MCSVWCPHVCWCSLFSHLCELCRGTQALQRLAQGLKPQRAVSTRKRTSTSFYLHIIVLLVPIKVELHRQQQKQYIVKNHLIIQMSSMSTKLLYVLAVQSTQEGNLINTTLARLLGLDRKSVV